MLAGYVPLSALVPSLVDKDKGAAVSVLNLGAGLAAFVGPLIVALFRNAIGYVGIVWFMAGLYILSAVMTYCIGEAFRMKIGLPFRTAVLFVFEGLRLLTLWERA